MESWFPMVDAAFNNLEFVALSPTEKLYFWLLVSEFNLSGPFYRADIWFAAALGVAEVTIRKARRKLQSLGLVNVTPGRQNSYGRNIATQYHSVKWSMPPNRRRKETGSWSMVDRHHFELMLALLRKGTISHQDLVVYVYLDHWYGMKSQFNDQVYISKKQLREKTNNPGAIDRLERVYHALSQVGDPLFEYRDEYMKIVISEWWHFDQDYDDPRWGVRALKKEIQQNAKRMRDNEPRKDDLDRVLEMDAE